MLETTAYLLVYHGSRDPRPQPEMDRLGEAVRDKLTARSQPKREMVSLLGKGDSPTRNPIPNGKLLSATSEGNTEACSPLVYTAALELAPLSLEDAIAQLLPSLHQQGITELQIIPLFLLPGVHVREDIPDAVENAQQKGGDQVKISLCPYIGQSPLMVEKLQSSFSDSENSAKIIISHGSRRLGGNQPIENLAKQLGVSAAYWSVSPGLDEQVERFVKEGAEKIEILPYFLFPGGITDAIAQQVQSLETQFPQVQFHLGPPLSHCLSLADIIIHEITV